MKAITLRKVPDDTYRSLVRLAQRNRRSLQQQVLTMLDRAKALDTESPLERAAELRRRFTGRPCGDTVDEVRQERLR